MPDINVAFADQLIRERTALIGLLHVELDKLGYQIFETEGRWIVSTKADEQFVAECDGLNGAMAWLIEKVQS